MPFSKRLIEKRKSADFEIRGVSVFLLYSLLFRLVDVARSMESSRDFHSRRQHEFSATRLLEETSITWDVPFIQLAWKKRLRVEILGYNYVFPTRDSFLFAQCDVALL